MLVKKHLSLNDVDLKFDGDSYKFSGYASVFGGVDSYGDTIEKGAFKETLSSAMPKMFFNHEWRMPVGKWVDAKEDDKGLFVEGELTKGVAIANDIYAAMKHGTLDGLSIGGYLKKGDYTETENGRTIHKWSQLAEISPVAFPADSSARLVSVKSEDFEFETIRDFERYLRDVGHSKTEALAIVSKTRKLFQGEPDVDEGTKNVLAKLEQIRSKLS
jgi:HK97 family phage prohead protease